jgi:hypothetical protein
MTNSQLDELQLVQRADELSWQGTDGMQIPDPLEILPTYGENPPTGRFFLPLAHLEVQRTKSIWRIGIMMNGQKIVISNLAPFKHMQHQNDYSKFA